MTAGETARQDAAHAHGDGGAFSRMLLHIGYHKTGSTYLQDHLFQPENGFSREIGADRTRIVRDFVFPDNFCFDPEAMRQAYRPFVEAADAGGLRFVLSHERLSGYPPSGGYDRLLIADRLARTFPEARVLIVLREQVSLIRSVYSQYITDGGYLSLGRFLEVPEPKLGRMPGFRLELYEFDRMIRHYQALFGRERVLVLPFEKMVRALPGFLADITGFVDLPAVKAVTEVVANQRRPMTMQLAQRWANRHFSNTELSRGGAIAIARFPRRFARLEPFFRLCTPRQVDASLHGAIERDIRAFVGAYYVESNRRTAELIDVDLGQYGYMA